MKNRLGTVVITAGAVVSLLGTGCNDPTARRMTAERQKRIPMWVGELARREQAGSAKVNAALKQAEQIWQTDVARTHRNGPKIETWVEDDLRRWHNRQRAYPTEIQRHVRGKPEKIQPTALLMFF